MTLLVAVVVLAAWAGSAVAAGLSARDDLLAAQASLQAAREAVREADLARTAGSLGRAVEQLEAGRSSLYRPDLAAATWIPWLGGDLRAAQTVADAALAVAVSGREAIDAIESLGGLEALAPGEGQLPSGALRALGPTVAETADAITTATGDLAAVAEPRVFDQVAVARARLLEELEPLAVEARRMADVTAVLPDLLGEGRPVRYFLAAANPAESRGTIGFMGSFAIATFDQGRLDIGEFRPLQELRDVPVDDVVGTPAEAFATRYRQFGGAGTWKNLNATPDFPSAARAIENLWRQTEGEPLDGTILVDPFAFKALLRLSGPVELPDGERLAADEVVEYVANQAYADYEDNADRKGALGAVAAVALTDFLHADGRGELTSTLGVLGDLVSRGHLLFHAADPDAQAVLSDLEMDSALRDPPGDLLAVVTNSASNSKVDYYARRKLVYDVTLADGGAVDGRLEVTLHNNAPTSGAAKHVLGPNVDELSVGDNRLLASAYCSTRCEWTADDAGAQPWTLGDELGHAVADAFVTIPRGESIELGYDRRVEQAWSQEGSERVYRLAYRDAVTIRPTEVEIRVAVPDGFRVATAPDGASIQGGRVLWSGQGRGDAHWEVRFAPGA